MADSFVELVQISDSHLFADPEATLLGINTDASLSAVLRLLDGRPRPALLLATGDNSQDGSVAAYRRFLEQVQGRGERFAWLPGNHDLPAVMAEVSPVGALVKQLDLGAWRLLLLDSTQPQSVAGHLAEAEFDFIEQSLRTAPQRPTLLAVHHPPCALGCAWLDGQGIDNGARLLTLLAGHPQVRLLLCGHIHQQQARQFGSFWLLSAPSTCAQFLPDSDDFALDSLGPGLRWLRLHDDGRFETGIERVAAGLFTADPSSTGY